MTQTLGLDPEDIRRLEATATSAWPPVKQDDLEGWLLGFDRSVTGRANSALANAPVPAAELEARIAEVERRYRAHGLPPRFKVSPGSLPADLDHRLAARGYRAEGHAQVLVADLDAALRASEERPQISLQLLQDPEPLWCEACWPEAAPAEAEARRLISARIASPRAFALARIDGAAAGAAVASVNQGWACITAVHTLAACRRRGVARALMAGLTAWAGVQGAARLYLQVEEGNRAAQALYAQLGFGVAYAYHYRRLAEG